MLEEIHRLDSFFKNDRKFHDYGSLSIEIPLPINFHNSNVGFIDIKGPEMAIENFIKNEFHNNLANKHLEKVLADKIMVEELKEQEGC
jgi:hypothetical protein